MARSTLGTEVEGLRRLSRQRGELTSARDHANRHTAGIGQIHREAADRIGQRAWLRAVGGGQPPHIGLVGRQERRADESRCCAAADEHTRRARIAATQIQLVAAARHRREAERMRKRLGANQIRLLEFQPGKVVDLDHRIQRPSGVLTAPGAVLTVQIGVGRHVLPTGLP